jgi:lysozyme
MDRAPFTVSRNGVLFIANREALVLTAYQDGPHPSIGFGSNSRDLRVGDTITVKDAFARLKADIAARESIVYRALRVALSRQQADALCSFYYQNGNKRDGQGRPGFTRMIQLINAGQIDEAAAYFPECDRNSAGEQKAGLSKRRLLEQAVFQRGDYGQLDPIPYWPGAPVGPPQQYHLKPGDLDA